MGKGGKKKGRRIIKRTLKLSKIYNIPNVLEVGGKDGLEVRHVRHVNRERVGVEHLEGVRETDGQLLVKKDGRNGQRTLALRLEDMSM